MRPQRGYHLSKSWRDFRFESWLRENSETEFANGNFVSTSINLKNKRAGDGCQDKTIEKTIPRAFRARTFSRSQGPKQTWALGFRMSAFASGADVETQNTCYGMLMSALPSILLQKSKIERR